MKIADVLFSWFKYTSSYVLMLERWMLPFSYIQRPTVLLVRNIVHEDHKWGFFSWFNHEFICPNVRALNATIFVHSTPTVLLVRNIVYEDCNELFSWFKHESICPDVRALNATFLVHVERWMPNSIIEVRDIVYEDRKWVFLVDLSTSLYFPAIDAQQYYW